MVDDEERHALVAEVDEITREGLGLRRVEAGRRLVEQQDARIRGDRPRQLEQPSLAVGQPARGLLGQVAQTDPGERVDRDGPTGTLVPQHERGAGTHDGRSPR